MFIIFILFYPIIIFSVIENKEIKQENSYLKELILKIEINERIIKKWENKEEFNNFYKEKLTKENIEKIRLETENKKYEILTKINKNELIKVLCNNKIIKFLGNYKIKEEIKEEKLNKSDAFRFIFRKYFCDQKLFKNNWSKYGNNFIDNDFDDISETSIDINKIFLKRNDNEFPHNYKEDFVFMVLYPIEFKKLWNLFKINLNEILISLTFSKINNLKKLNKRESQYLISWDKKLFIKSILTKPKWYTKLKEKGISKFLIKFIKNTIDPIAEKNFFFSEYVQFNYFYDSFGYWSFEERQNSKNFKGGFLDYFYYIFNIIKNGGNTLLPKYLFIFKFMPIPNNNKNKYFTIQNGLFPKGIPKINLKFDLKGASRKILDDELLNEYYNNNKEKEQILMDIEFTQIFPEGIIFDNNEKYEEFVKMIEKDSKFLAERDIIDYSLLLGIHFINEENKENNFSFNSSLNWMNGISAKAIICNKYLFNKITNIKLNSEEEEKNNKKCKIIKLLLFGGIIDILQTYTFKRKLKQKILEFEAKNKNEKHEIFPEELPMSIIEPELYQKRFVKFLTNKVFIKKTETKN